VKYLLNYNQSLNLDIESDNGQFTPLMISCMRGEYEIVEVLISKGVNVNKKNLQGQTALFFCFTRLEEPNNHFENMRICLKMAELLL